MNGSLRSEARPTSSPDSARRTAIPTQADPHTHCRSCLTPAPDGLFRVVGAWSLINGVAIWDCESCARKRLLEIEDGQDVRTVRR
ncbi:hypothetical protein [Kineosporia babensis]|uniref:Uncharacterized protein n=1 Tax=Kineosporia babensis TaxID=499548 RepID=A0A9X1NHG9_9ACTN|nr:hypothetical protein [Kineosporia babensis]MCD5313639.1 hypothetical protein [Kineosporia babensis]